MATTCTLLVFVGLLTAQALVLDQVPKAPPTKNYRRQSTATRTEKKVAIGREPDTYFNVHVRCEDCGQNDPARFQYDVCMSNAGQNPDITKDMLKDRMMQEASHPATAWKMYTTLPIVEGWDEWKEKCGTCKDLRKGGKLRAKKDEKEEEDFFKGMKDAWQSGAQAASMMQESTPSKAGELAKIFYINVDGSDYRKNKIEGNLAWTAKGFQVERFRATTGEEARGTDLSLYTEKGMADYMDSQYGDKKWNTAAVYMSQVNLLRHIQEIDPDGEGIYIILEDDAQLPEDFTSRTMQLIQSHVPEDWDILKLGRPWWSYLRCEDKVNSQIFEARTPDFGNGMKFYAGNVGYAIRPKSIPSILQQLKDVGIMDVDGAMMSMKKNIKREGEDGKTYYYNWGARTYAVAYRIVTDPAGDSDRMKFFQKFAADTNATKSV